MQTLQKYLIQRLLGYTIILDGILCLLVTMVEGFERMVRTHHVGSGTIIHYTLLQIVPNLITYLPLAAWLATVLLIRTLRARGEWELMAQLGISSNTIARHFFVCTLTLSSFAGLCYETVGHKLAGHAQYIRLTAFKQLDTGTIHATWFPVNNRDICYIHHLDLKTGLGNGLVLVQFDRLGNTSVLHTPTFLYNRTSQEFITTSAKQANLSDGRTWTVEHHRLFVPAFSWQQLLAQEQRSLFELAQQCLTAPQTLPQTLLTSLHYKLTTRITGYTHIVLYPLLTLATMTLLPTGPLSWLGALLPCLGLTITPLIFETIAGPASWSLLLILNFLLALLTWCILRRRN